ncbi:hypothetical protein K440DRAFT_670999 [Wilcoxina mikolae CBS 423.85]|nr:hypothetical protein K440DRAFT_670999 [Wilcoxina mikolae CBS 423.85]
MPLLTRAPTPFHHTGSPTGSPHWDFFDEALAIASSNPSTTQKASSAAGVLAGAIKAAVYLPSLADDHDKGEKEEGEEEKEEEEQEEEEEKEEEERSKFDIIQSAIERLEKKHRSELATPPRPAASTVRIHKMGAVGIPVDTRCRPTVRKEDEITIIHGKSSSQSCQWLPEIIEISDEEEDENGLEVLAAAAVDSAEVEGELEEVNPGQNIEEPRTPIRKPSSSTSTPTLTTSSSITPRTPFSPHTPPNPSSGGDDNINSSTITTRVSFSTPTLLNRSGGGDNTPSSFTTTTSSSSSSVSLPSPTPPNRSNSESINIPLHALAVQNGITKDPFSLPTILHTDSLGNTLFMQRALITRSLSALRTLPVTSTIPAARLLSTLNMQLSIHAETLDRSGAWARTVSNGGNMKMRQENAQHGWKRFLELREEVREVRRAREEAAEVVEGWKAFRRWDLGAEEEGGEGEEEGEEEEEKGLGGFIEACVEVVEGVEWTEDAIETLRVAAEGWTSRWLSFRHQQPAAEEEVMQKKRKRESTPIGKERKKKRGSISPTTKKQRREARMAMAAKVTADNKSVLSESEILKGWIPEKWN